MEIHSMKKSINVRSAAFVTGLVAVTATAWAANETLQLVPTSTIPAVVIEEHELKAAEPLRTEDTLAKDEVIVTEVPAEPALPARQVAVERPAAAPVVERATIAEPAITVEQKRLTLDERIQADVLDRLAAAPNISGRIGVETEGARVTLTGYTVTAAQGQRAERLVRGVDGVRDVSNLIRARVGGSV
jgi:hypothetical protein